VGKIHCTAIQANSTAIKLTYRKLPVTQITKVYMHVLRDIAISKLIRFWMKCSYKKIKSCWGERTKMKKR